MKILIKNDLYDIADRIREINADYRVFFDTDRQKFILMRNNALELIFPFEELDERVIRHARYTSVQNVKEFLHDLDKENRETEEDSRKKAKDKVEDEFSRRLRLLGV